MNRTIKNAILGIAIMFSVNFAFGQEIEVSASSQKATIAVTIIDKGHNCPANGIVKSRWWWKENGSSTYKQKDGTSAFYTHEGETVILESIDLGLQGNYIAEKVYITIEPSGHPEANNTIQANKPFSPVGISAGTCGGGGTPYTPNPNN